MTNLIFTYQYTLTACLPAAVRRISDKRKYKINSDKFEPCVTIIFYLFRVVPIKEARKGFKLHARVTYTHHNY